MEESRARSAARPTRRRAASGCPQDDGEANYPLILVTGDREKSYHHSRFRDQPWALKVSPDPRLTDAPRHGARPGARRRRLGAARGGARQRRLPPAHQALRCDAARRGQHRHGLVAAVRSPRPSTARSTSTSMPRSPTTARMIPSPAPPTCAACLAGWKRSGLERHPTAACGAAVSPRSSFHRCTSRKPCSRAARSNGFCSTTKPSPRRPGRCCYNRCTAAPASRDSAGGWLRQLEPVDSARHQDIGENQIDAPSRGRAIPAPRWRAGDRLTV